MSAGMIDIDADQVVFIIEIKDYTRINFLRGSPGLIQQIYV